MQIEEFWVNDAGEPVPLFQLTDEELTKYRDHLTQTDIENRPRFKFELERRGLYETSNKPE